jgi:signal transduction histidine kinase
MLQEYPGEVFAQIKERVQLSLTDLRFVIDSLDPVLNDLPTLLGMMRARLGDQLAAENVSLEWFVTDLPELPDMSPQRSLHIMRIVQEVMSNAIKHSGTQAIRLETKFIAGEEAYISVMIRDYGKGIDRQAMTEPSGRGMKNLLFRAEQMGAIFEYKNAPDGKPGALAELRIPYSSKS